MTKKMISVKACDVYIEGDTVQGFIKECQRYLEDYGPTARFAMEYDRYAEKDYLVVNYEREETDEEYEKRLKQEEQFKSYRDKRDAEEYERLKKKFENVESN